MTQKKDPFDKTRVPKALARENIQQQIDKILGPSEVTLEILALAKQLLLNNHIRIVEAYTSASFTTITDLAKQLKMNSSYLGQILKRPDVAKYLMLYNKYHFPAHTQILDDQLFRRAESGDLKALELYYKRHNLIRTNNVVAAELTNNQDGSQTTRIIINPV